MSPEPEMITHRLLVIDDNPAIHADFRRILAAQSESAASAAEAGLFGKRGPSAPRPKFDLDSAMQGQEGVELVRQALEQRRPYSVAFVDMRMPPGWDGLVTVEKLWAIDPDVQIVICSAYSDYDWVELLERLGNSDKLMVVKKPFDPIEVLQSASALSRKWQNERALKHHIEGLEHVVTDRTQGLEAANRQLRHLASHDALTGLPNRLLLNDRLSQAIVVAEQQQLEFAVLVVDLDRFKQINDSLGHRAGDDLLKEVAHRLKCVVRAVDTTARVGGHEFVMILNGPTTRARAIEVGEQAIEALKAPVSLLGIKAYVSPSIGVAFYPTDGNSLEALLAHADAAMNCGRAQGRNGVQCYVAGMNENAPERVKLESDLHEALARKQFELHYQPKVDTKTGEVHSAEALIRWRHPARGLVPPDQFIPLAEECGLMDPIGEWVLFEACRQAKAWQREGLQPLRIAVNLAPSQFRLTNLVALIRRALEVVDLEPRFLEIELTESAIMSDAEESIAILEAISRMGIQVSVDDFGTGYSSMSYLRRFPIDKLKIDRSFVSEVTSRPEDAAIVRAIVSLAHSLHLKVVAEGVETSAQLAFMRDLGCEQYQGYYFSKALPPVEFADLLRKSSKQTEADDMSLRTHSKLAVLSESSMHRDLRWR